MYSFSASTALKTGGIEITPVSVAGRRLPVAGRQRYIVIRRGLFRNVANDAVRRVPASGVTSKINTQFGVPGFPVITGGKTRAHRVQRTSFPHRMTSWETSAIGTQAPRDVPRKSTQGRLNDAHSQPYEAWRGSRGTAVCPFHMTATIDDTLSDRPFYDELGNASAPRQPIAARRHQLAHRALNSNVHNGTPRHVKHMMVPVNYPKLLTITIITTNCCTSAFYDSPKYTYQIISICPYRA